MKNVYIVLEQLVLKKLDYVPIAISILKENVNTYFLTASMSQWLGCAFRFCSSQSKIRSRTRVSLFKILIRSLDVGGQRSLIAGVPSQ